jgi:Outer membrane protein beta-barrel domain
MTVSSAALIATPMNAQEFHLSAGYNGSNVQKAGDEGWVGRGGYQFGADVKLGQRWFLEPGIHFMVRNLNFTYTTAADIPAQEFRYTSRSLRVPLMLGLDLMDQSEDPDFNVSIMGGPTALIGLSSQLDQQELSVTTRGTQWYLGFAGEVTLGFLFVNAGYDVAMSNVFDGDRFSTNPKVNFYHASAGVRLKLAK